MFFLSPLSHPCRVLDFLFSDSLNVFINSVDVVCDALWMVILQNGVRIVHIPLPPVQGTISRGQSFPFERLRIHVADNGEQSGIHSSTMNLKVELTNKLKTGTFQAPTVWWRLRASQQWYNLSKLCDGHDICRRRGEQDFSWGRKLLLLFNFIRI